MSPEALNHIKTALETCETPKERTNEASRLSRYYGVSVKTFWRWAHKAGFRVRSVRSDKGSSEITDADLKLIAARLLVSKQLRSRFSNTVKNVLEQLEREGRTFPVGYERICRLLKDKGLDKAHLSAVPAHIRLISKHPNHVWQFDVTNCLQWHLDKKTGLTERDVELSFYNNKLVKSAKAIKRELLRFVMVDHCTGAFFFWYYYSPGERAEDGADFFFKAFSKKDSLMKEYLNTETGMYQMHGVPFMLVSDKGSILRQKAVCNMMDALGVNVQLHAAGNPRAKGKVERLMSTIGTKFETILKVRRPADLAELNRWALAWCVQHNESFTGKKQQAPAAYWLRIRREELRLCPDEKLFKTLIHRSEVERTVDGSGHISFEGRTYYIPDVNAMRQKIKVKINAYEYPAVDVHFNGYVWTVNPLKTDDYGRTVSPSNVEYGSYRALPHTITQKNVSDLEQIASDEWGVTFKGNKQKRQSLAPEAGTEKIEPAATVTRQEKVSHIQKQGTEIETPNIHAPLTESEPRNYTVTPMFDSSEKRISISDLILRIVREVRKLSVEENKAIKARWKNGVTATEADQIIQNMLNNTEVKHAESHYG
ncbi:MAG: hypothetical protein AB7E48_03085 [Deferribacterales bacterium]